MNDISRWQSVTPPRTALREIAPGEWRNFLERRGTGAASFGTRLERARLVYLRRRELVANWLALAVVASCWYAESEITAMQEHASQAAIAPAGGEQSALFVAGEERFDRSEAFYLGGYNAKRWRAAVSRRG
jgi:hypothetical protein